MAEVRLQTPSEVSVPFLQGMADRMAVSFHKYGPVTKAYPDSVDAVASLRARLRLYGETGNAEYLMDVANFAMIEFMLPKHNRAHFDPEAESPGRTLGDGTVSMRDNERLAD